MLAGGHRLICDVCTHKIHGDRLICDKKTHIQLTESLISGGCLIINTFTTVDINSCRMPAHFTGKATKNIIFVLFTPKRGLTAGFL